MQLGRNTGSFEDLLITDYVNTEHWHAGTYVRITNLPGQVAITVVTCETVGVIDTHEKTEFQLWFKLISRFFKPVQTDRKHSLNGERVTVVN